MTGNLGALATRYVGRPLLLTPSAALDLSVRLQQVDARAFERPSRLSALLRGLSRARPGAMEDDYDDTPPVPMSERLAYAPLFVGEPDDVGYGWSLVDGVAMMCADKPLLAQGENYCGEVYHGYDTLLTGMREAAADDRVGALFVRMFCPGGVVDGRLDHLAAWMRSARAAAGGKPIWVYADMAASAAYWIAAQADRIIAPRTGLVGSIGAVIVHESYAGALEKAGVEITPIQFGALKTDGAWWEKLSPTALAGLQAEIDQCGRNFVADVEAGRPAVTAQAAIDTRAECFLASHDDPERSGLARGLVDAIASEEDAFLELRDLVAASRSAPAPQPSSASATGGRAAKPTETPMAGKAQTQPGRQSALARARLAKARADAELARLEEEEAQAAEEGEGDPEDPAVDPETPPADAEEDPVDPEAAEDDDQMVNAKTAQAILALPEAKGREALAQRLAFKPGMTVAEAKADLAAAPRRSALADRMVGQDPKITGSGAPAAARAPLSTADRFEANRKAGLEKRASGLRR